MKRFWLILLSLGLVMAFSASAFAVDVKFSGSFYAAGVYLDKTKFIKDAGTVGDGISTAYYYQRLRVQTDFIVSPGLKLVTRFDALERLWGQYRTAAATNRGYSSAFGIGSDINSSGTTAENENIAFDWAYIEYISPIGMFRVGFMDDGVWGTPFNDSSAPFGKVMYANQIGPMTFGAYLSKYKEESAAATTGFATATDRDIDMYCAFGIFGFKGGSAGLLYKGYRVALTRIAGYKQLIHVLIPYAVAQIGPVKIQAELNYAFGDYLSYDSGSGNVKLDNLAGWVDATADLGIVYFGGSIAYISGDDYATTDKKEGGVLTGGTDWNPALIMFNFDRYYWGGQINGYGSTKMPLDNDTPLGTHAGGMSNAWFFQGRVGVRPMAPLDIVASVNYAQAVQKWAPVNGGTAVPTNSDSYGWELDITGTYKITNNLSYMLGAGYLWTGDYFKGSTGNTLVNDYLIINKLTLTF